MKKYAILTLITLFAFSFWNCEKDDICADSTPSTPRVVIEFYDAANPTVLKTVTNLGIIAPGFTEGFGFNGVSKITVPLKTTDNTSSLQFIENGSDADSVNDNVDEITFNYTRQDIYVSRACGYKTNFTLDAATGAVLTADASNWIQSITIEQITIANENETHIKIYF
ncbi:DUF6452 family protein [Flavobacterium sp.]|jgi:hypothetical protein|uniref:DUF6452 family protein n=1 Tax=Flavobacterium sp. TaxID=239 RepID=UPI002A8275C3|nr:DUF6452 family protein [Flavobacterium sp.]